MENKELPERWFVKVYANSKPATLRAWRDTTHYKRGWTNEGYIDYTGYWTQDRPTEEGVVEIGYGLLFREVLKSYASSGFDSYRPYVMIELADEKTAYATRSVDEAYKELAEWILANERTVFEDADISIESKQLIRNHLGYGENF